MRKEYVLSWFSLCWCSPKSQQLLIDKNDKGDQGEHTETFFIIYLPLIGIQEVPNKTFTSEHIEWEGGRGFKTINDYGNFHLLRNQHQFSLKHHKTHWWAFWLWRKENLRGEKWELNDFWMIKYKLGCFQEDGESGTYWQREREMLSKVWKFDSIMGGPLGVTQRNFYNVAKSQF